MSTAEHLWIEPLPSVTTAQDRVRKLWADAADPQALGKAGRQLAPPWCDTRLIGRIDRFSRSLLSNVRFQMLDFLIAAPWEREQVTTNFAVVASCHRRTWGLTKPKGDPSLKGAESKVYALHSHEALWNLYVNGEDKEDIDRRIDRYMSATPDEFSEANAYIDYALAAILIGHLAGITRSHEGQLLTRLVRDSKWFAELHESVPNLAELVKGELVECADALKSIIQFTGIIVPLEHEYELSRVVDPPSIDARDLDDAWEVWRNVGKARGLLGNGLRREMSSGRIPSRFIAAIFDAGAGAAWLRLSWSKFKDAMEPMLIDLPCLLDFRSKRKEPARRACVYTVRAVERAAGSFLYKDAHTGEPVAKSYLAIPIPSAWDRGFACAYIRFTNRYGNVDGKPRLVDYNHQLDRHTPRWNLPDEEADLAEAIRVVLSEPCSSSSPVRTWSSAPQRKPDVQIEEFLIGNDPSMVELRRWIRMVSATPYPVFLFGETGTGKELVAKLIHNLSGRSGEFVAMNLGGIPDTLVRDELFGHERGAFTDAKFPRIGACEQADRGTLFLDEVGVASPHIQTTLLRFLETRRLEKLGTANQKTVDVRVVAATNVLMSKLLLPERVRQDIWTRLGVLHFELPPLRERRNDVRLLVSHFLAEEGASQLIGTITDEAWAVFTGYTWPGNVREARTVAQRLAVYHANATHVSGADAEQLLDPPKLWSGRHSSSDDGAR